VIRYAAIGAMVAMTAPDILGPSAAGGFTFSAIVDDGKFPSALVMLMVSAISRNAFIGLASGMLTYWLIA
jgi:branched-subunit amino acid transport protein